MTKRYVVNFMPKPNKTRFGIGGTASDVLLNTVSIGAVIQNLRGCDYQFIAPSKQSPFYFMEGKKMAPEEAKKIIEDAARKINY